MPTKSQTAKIRTILEANGQLSHLRHVLANPIVWKQLLTLYPQDPVRVA